MKTERAGGRVPVSKYQMKSNLEWKGFRLEETGACPLCGSEGQKKIYGFPPFHVVRCTDCSIAYLSPRMHEPDIRRIYEDPSYFSAPSSEFGYGNYAVQAAGLRKSFSLLVKKLDSCGVSGGDLLEIGCGPGLFLKEARAFFSRTTGLDYSETALKTAAHHADRVIKGDVNRLGEEDQFDMIAAISLLEHVYDPMRFMRILIKHLRQDGSVLFITPDFDGIWRRIMGHGWPSFKIPEHVLYYNRESLSKLGREYHLNSTFFHFTQFAPISLVCEVLSMGHAISNLEMARSILLPVPFTMLCVLYSR